MKRAVIVTLISLAMLAGGFPLPAFTQATEKPVSVTVDGLPVTFDVRPVIQTGRTLVPFRAIAEALNVEVRWDGSTKIVSATDGKTAIRLQIGNKTAYRNGEPIPLDVPPQVISGRAMLPLRFFSEAFACKVAWDETRREPAERVREAVEMARVAVPPEKLVLGISVPNETPESVLTKVGIAKRYSLGGIAIWRLGLVNNEMWDALRGTVIARR